jgi:hypothetical protein
MPGSTYWEKTNNALGSLEAAFSTGSAFADPEKQYPITSIVVDCASTMCEKFYAESLRSKKAKDPRQNYGEVKTWATEVMARLDELNVPTIWLSWLKEPQIEEESLGGGAKSKRVILGGPNIVGSFRTVLGGKAHQILYLEKVKPPPGATIEKHPDLCSDGWIRRLHTKTYANIEANGRYTTKLPEPCPPDLAWILNQICS